MNEIRLIVSVKSKKPNKPPPPKKKTSKGRVGGELRGGGSGVPSLPQPGDLNPVRGKRRGAGLARPESSGVTALQDRLAAPRRDPSPRGPLDSPAARGPGGRARARGTPLPRPGRRPWAHFLSPQLPHPQKWERKETRSETAARRRKEKERRALVSASG